LLLKREGGFLPMSIAKKLMLLVVLVVAWQVAMVPVRADNACQQACANTYNSCIAESGDQRQMCYTQAEWSYNGCLLSAYGTAEDCIENAYANCMGGGCSPHEVQHQQQLCGEEYQNATQECASGYSSETASCNIAEQAANVTCGNAYNACYNNCGPE
jgi:hypothetical protein